MLDPREGVDADGMICTGVDRVRIPVVFEPVVSSLMRGFAEVTARIESGVSASLLLYGSVATGTAHAPSSDVDAVTVGLPVAETAALSESLSRRFAGVCRGVEVAPAQLQHYVGDDDEAYGNRVFLRHYCVLLSGPDHAAGWRPFPADVSAARGFNGDVARHLARWRSALDQLDDLDDRAAALLGRRVARKTLLAVAGLVSVHDRGWTTDRVGASRRWSQLRPEESRGLEELANWTEFRGAARPADLHRVLNDDGAVARIVACFRDDIGLWDRSLRDPRTATPPHDLSARQRASGGG